MRKIKTMLAALAILATSLIGFTAAETAIAPTAGASCSGVQGLDLGWHDGNSQVFHVVVDQFYNADCTYVTHYVVDCFYRVGGQQLACAQGWLDAWNGIQKVQDGTYSPGTGLWGYGYVIMGTPDPLQAGVALMDDQSNSAWCQLDWSTPQHQAVFCARPWSGSEFHTFSVSTTYIGPQSGKGARVNLNF